MRKCIIFLIYITLIISFADSIFLRLKYENALEMAKKCEAIAHKEHIDTQQRLYGKDKKLHSYDKEFLNDLDNKELKQ